LAKWLLLHVLLYVQSSIGQSIVQFDGKWCFTGFRTTIFKAQQGKLYVGMIEHVDTANFNRFVQSLPVDSGVFREATVTQHKDSIFINASFPAIQHDLSLIYLPADSNNILFTGDVYFDSTRVIITNANCTMTTPVCSNRLYSRYELRELSRLKTHGSFTRDDAFEFLLRINQKLKTKCNRCYAGFTDAWMNEVLIEMGFNPVAKKQVNKSVWYTTSGFTSFVKEKFAADERMVRLMNQMFDWYLLSK
jgi:hypothetical protein